MKTKLLVWICWGMMTATCIFGQLGRYPEIHPLKAVVNGVLWPVWTGVLLSEEIAARKPQYSLPN